MLQARGRYTQTSSTLESVTLTEPVQGGFFIQIPCSDPRKGQRSKGQERRMEFLLTCSEVFGAFKAATASQFSSLVVEASRAA